MPGVKAWPFFWIIELHWKIYKNKVAPLVDKY